MSWLIFALAAPAIYALINFIDKYLLERVIKDYRGMPMYTGISGLIVGTILWIINGFPLLKLSDALLVLSTGILSIWGIATYYKALTEEATSKIIVLFQMTPIFTLILSTLFLNESITIMELLGFLLILFAAVNMSMTDSRGKFKLNRAFFLIILTDILFALAYVLFRFVVEGNSFAKIISFESWGIFIGSVILYLIFPGVRKGFRTNNTHVPIWGLGIVVLAESIYVGAKMLTYSAISLGAVSLVSVLEGTQVFYGVLYGLLLTLIAPRVFKEDISRNGILKAIFFAALVFVGITLLR